MSPCPDCCRGLRYAVLSMVTIEWVVLLRVGAVFLNPRYGVGLLPSKPLAIGVIVGLQTYLIGA